MSISVGNVVKFEYHDRTRIVKVTKSDGTTLEGIDLTVQDGNQFRRFIIDVDDVELLLDHWDESVSLEGVVNELDPEFLFGQSRFDTVDIQKFVYIPELKRFLIQKEDKPEIKSVGDTLTATGKGYIVNFSLFNRTLSLLNTNNEVINSISNATFSEFATYARQYCGAT